MNELITVKPTTRTKGFREENILINNSANEDQQKLKKRIDGINDLKQYNKIIPCGITNKGVTNLKNIVDQDYSKLDDKLIENFISNLKI